MDRLAVYQSRAHAQYGTCNSLKQKNAAIKVPGSFAGFSMRKDESGFGPKASYVQPVHLSYRIASAGRDTRRYDKGDFREIVCGEHNVALLEWLDA
jgi:hypothetical protein